MLKCCLTNKERDYNIVIDMLIDTEVDQLARLQASRRSRSAGSERVKRLKINNIDMLYATK